jgi:hypothetical protein
MKFINIFVALFIVLLLPSCNKNDKRASEMYPPYKLITTFSQKIKPETDLVLYSYGVNNYLPKDYQFKNGVACFGASYALYKNKQDEVSIEYARTLVVYLTEGLLKEINTDPKLRPDLDIYPFTSDLIRIAIYFKDENKIDLGQGVASVYFSKGKIEYERYDIREYTGRYPAYGKHFTIHEESYAEALDIVKEQRYSKLRNPPPRPISLEP